jgi:hypothetical protein
LNQFPEIGGDYMRACPLANSLVLFTHDDEEKEWQGDALAEPGRSG